MIGAVKKGSSLEYKVTWDLRNSGLFPDARRTGIRGKRALSSRISEPGDVYAPSLPFSIECKNQENIKGFYKYWDQATAQNIPPKQPLLVVKSNKNPALAVLDWEEFLFLLRAALKGGYPK